MIAHNQKQVPFTNLLSESIEELRIVHEFVRPAVQLIKPQSRTVDTRVSEERRLLPKFHCSKLLILLKAREQTEHEYYSRNVQVVEHQRPMQSLSSIQCAPLGGD